MPCAAEIGFPETAKLLTFFGLYIHKNTPEGIKETLISVFKKILDDPEFKKRLDQFGDVPRFGDPKFMVDTIKKAEEVGVPIIKELGLYVGK